VSSKASAGRRPAAKNTEDDERKPQEEVGWKILKFGQTPAKELGIVYATSAREAIDEAIREKRATEAERFRLVAERF
jgi:hypothetical protein